MPEEKKEEAKPKPLAEERIHGRDHASLPSGRESSVRDFVALRRDEERRAELERQQREDILPLHEAAHQQQMKREQMKRARTRKWIRLGLSAAAVIGVLAVVWLRLL